jgi:hypothetical protein
VEHERPVLRGELPDERGGGVVTATRAGVIGLAMRLLA